MTHLEKFIALYKEVGIALVPVARDEKIEDYNGLAIGPGFTLIIGEGQTEPKEKIGGYFGFYTEIYFDKKGNFIKQDFWE